MPLEQRYFCHSKGGWNGMVGDILRNEAELAIGPLTVSSAREQVVDFSAPFMPGKLLFLTWLIFSTWLNFYNCNRLNFSNCTAEIAILVKEANTRFESPGLFSFLQPLSQEIWVGIFCSYVAVSFVIFIVSR